MSVPPGGPGGGVPSGHEAGQYLRVSAEPPPAAAVPGAPAFASVVMDVDSTVSGIEGIDWLAARRGRKVAEQVAQLTMAAMNGEVSLDDVYGRRLDLVRPTESDIEELAEAYQQALAPGAIEAVAGMRDAGVRLVLVSGGIRQAILPLASRLGFTHAEVFAVRAAFDPGGTYVGYDEASPLTRQDGKGRVVQRLYLRRPLLAVGDGSTDLAMRPAADAFAAFTGFARRAAVVRAADHEVRTFSQLAALVLS